MIANGLDTMMINFKLYKFCLVIITFIFITTNIEGIIRRHDLTDYDYLQDEITNAAIVSWSGCTATLIAERWVITASHCVLGFDGNGRQTDPTIAFLGSTYKLQGSPISHPEYVSIRNNGYDERIRDIALLHLQTPVLDVTPINLYELDDELNQQIEIWGYGKTGDGATGQTESFGRLRRGTSTVSNVSEHELYMMFTNPDSGNATEFEGHIGNGDSGGPAILRINHESFIAGVGATAAAFNAPIFFYGSESIYEKVSGNLSWLKLQMGDDYPGNYNGPLYQAPTLIGSLGGNNPNSGSGVDYPILVLLLVFRLFNNNGKGRLIKAGLNINN